MTEPSGHGEFAEAMRELIADLRPAHSRLLLLRGGRRAELQGTRSTSPVRARPPLTLVR